MSLLAKISKSDVVHGILAVDITFLSTLEASNKMNKVFMSTFDGTTSIKNTYICKSITTGIYFYRILEAPDAFGNYLPSCQTSRC